MALSKQLSAAKREWVETKLKLERMKGAVMEVNSEMVRRQETIQKLKLKINQILNGTTLGEADVNGDRSFELKLEEGVKDFGINPLSLFPEEIWDKILKNLTAPKELKNCNKTCKLFRKLLRPTRTTWLFDEVFPLVRPHMSSSEILNCRQVSKTWNAGVDAVFENHLALLSSEGGDVSPRLPPNHPPALRKDGKPLYSFSNFPAIRPRPQDFLDKMRDHDQIRNPFIGRSVTFSSSEPEMNVIQVQVGQGQGFPRPARQRIPRPAQQGTQLWEPFYELFEKFGSHLWSLHLVLQDTDCSEMHPFLLQPLASLAPNLKSLRLSGYIICSPIPIWPTDGVPQLESLEVDLDVNFSDIDRLDSLQVILVDKTWSTLKRLRIRWNNWKHRALFTRDWSNLTELHLLGVEEEINVSALTRAHLPNVGQLGLTPKGQHFWTDSWTGGENFKSVMEIVTCLSPKSKLHTLQISGGFPLKQVRQVQGALFAPPSLTTLEVENVGWSRYYHPGCYTYLLHFPFLENLTLLRAGVGNRAQARLRESIVGDPHPQSESPMDILDLHKYIVVGGGSLYLSNVWRMLPRLKVITVQDRVYTRHGYEQFSDWEKKLEINRESGGGIPDRGSMESPDSAGDGESTPLQQEWKLQRTIKQVTVLNETLCHLQSFLDHANQYFAGQDKQINKLRTQLAKLEGREELQQ